jgi:hypothetical protein
MRRCCLYIAVAVFAATWVATLAAPMPVAAGNVKFERIGTIASQSYDSGPGNCIHTAVFVELRTDVNRDASGTVVEQTFLGIEVDQANFCTGEAILTAVGDVTLPSGAVKITMRGTSLTTTVNAFDNVTGNTIPFDIDLTWTGFGQKTNDNSVSHFGNGINCRSHSALRAASVSGTVSSGGTVYGSDPWGEAVIEHLNEVCTT